jgi:HD-GYP domain-containing protein (c-di-GMP phosphodiesterase class II)/sensor domain CHASE-containing protein
LNLRLKTILTVSICVFILMLTVYILLGQRTISAALELEQKDLSRNLTRAKNAVISELRQLETTTLDWAVFDEAYEFVLGTNPRFAQRNLTSNLGILNLEYFMIEKRDRVLLTRQRLEGDQYRASFEALGGFINSERWLWRESQMARQYMGQYKIKSGLVSKDQQLYFVAQAAIVPSSSPKPANGQLTMVRILDIETLKKLSELTQVKIKVLQKTTTDFDSPEKKALQSLLAGESQVFFPVNNDNIDGFTLLSDPTSSGVLLLEVQTQRTTYQTARDYLQRLGWSLTLIGILVTALIYGLLEFGLLSRLTSVYQELGQIAISGDAQHRLPVRGQDEIGLLTQQINTVLFKVEETQVKSAQLETRLERLRNIELEASLEATRLELFERLARVAEFRDNETSLHTSRVGEIAAAIAIQMGIHPEETERLRFAARLHDIGKIAIPDSILFKPSGLEGKEWSLMQTHAALGAQMLEGSGSPLLEMARIIALTHHERWNGSGYPLGLRGEEIPLMGRIVAVADTFDALLSPRPYKPAWILEDALGEIETHSNYLFDPNVVKALIQTHPSLTTLERKKS